MTDRIESSEPVEPSHAVIEAFIDGEVVDPAMLRSALAHSAARDHFVDLLIIRGALQRMDAVALSVAPPSHRARGRARWIAAVAAAAIVSVSAGYVTGQRELAESLAPSTVEAVVIVDSAPAAPPPTRSITLTPGVNWTDSTGGR
jgi:aminoglycoside phosphotransferase (APT) family kinase protein